MPKAKSSLGRGLDALINPALIDDNQSVNAIDPNKLRYDDGKSENILIKVQIDFIQPNPYQPRLNFEPEALEELKKSILINGLIQPITVRRLDKNKYQLISGERRLRAFKDLGYKEIPAYIIKVDSDEILLALALIENIQREKLNPIEIALAYKRLIKECNLTQEDIADKVGKDRTTVANTIRLLKLPKEIQQALIDEKITMGHARAILSLPDDKLKIFAYQKIVNENLSVRKIEKLAKSFNSSESKNIIKTKLLSSKKNNNIQIHEIEDRFQKIFGTKVNLIQKSNGAGEIVIHFFSNDEFERILELLESFNEKFN